jgi:hypothetical protein
VQKPLISLSWPRDFPEQHALVALMEMLALFDAETVLVLVLSVDVLLVGIIISYGEHVQD